MKKTITILVCAILSSFAGYAQYVDSSKGLLFMPSAEMEPAGTFSISNNFLNKSYLENPKHNEIRWGYSTFSYGFGIAFWSRVEIYYVCTMFNGKWSPYAKSKRARIIRNQDRHFAARFLLMKENEFGWNWVPALVVGTSDPITGSGGDYKDGNVLSNGGNGYFSRYYIAATKHFDTGWGTVGAHVAYQKSIRKYIVPHGPQVGLTWNPVWLNIPGSFLSSTRLIAEYDGKEVNLGATAAIWKDHFEFWGCLQDCKHFNGGLRFKIVLSGAE